MCSDLLYQSIWRLSSSLHTWSRGRTQSKHAHMQVSQEGPPGALSHSLLETSLNMGFKSSTDK